MLPIGFEPTISAGKRPQTYALDRAVTGTGDLYLYLCVCIGYSISVYKTSVNVGFQNQIVSYLAFAMIEH